MEEGAANSRTAPGGRQARYATGSTSKFTSVGAKSSFGHKNFNIIYKFMNISRNVDDVITHRPNTNTFELTQLNATK